MGFNCIRLEKKVAIVTGAAHGIGEAIALRLAEEGASIGVGDIDFEAAVQVADAIKKLGRDAIPLKADVSNGKEVGAMVKAVMDRFGRVDILVNNAGGSARERNALFHESKEEVWDYVIAKNLKAVLNCSRAVINQMIERKSGKIINIASCASIVGDAGVADYSAAKAGIVGFSMALAKEVAQYGVNVNCVSPGPIETRAMKAMAAHVEKYKRITGMGRLGKPGDIAAAVAFLASSDADFITGQNLPVCGLRNLGGAD